MSPFFLRILPTVLGETTIFFRFRITAILYFDQAGYWLRIFAISSTTFQSVVDVRRCLGRCDFSFKAIMPTVSNFRFQIRTVSRFSPNLLAVRLTLLSCLRIQSTTLSFCLAFLVKFVRTAQLARLAVPGNTCP